MDKASARILNETNRRFYETVSASFSETRANPWPGWSRVMEEIEAAAPGFAPRKVIDIACGNLRFEKFLNERMGAQGCAGAGAGAGANAGAGAGANADANPIASPAFHTFDNCEPLVSLGAQEVAHRSLDIVEALLAGTLEDELSSAGQADLAVSFGFFHHVPGFDTRAKLLRAMLRTLAPGGFAAISLWRFMDDAKLAAKARTSHADALSQLAAHDPGKLQLDENDWLLGWQNSKAVRYCHHFADEEVGALVRSAQDEAALVADFTADGKGGALNRYLVLRRLPAHDGGTDA